MRPIDAETGELWDEDVSRAKWNQIHRDAIAELCKRDEERSEGKLTAETGYKVTVEDGDRPGKQVVDRHLASLKHTRREERLLAQKRWAEFCKEPRPQSEARGLLRQEARGKLIEAWTEEYEREFGKGAVAVAEPPKPEPEVHQPRGQEIATRPEIEEPAPKVRRRRSG